MGNFWVFGEGDIFLGIFCGKGCLTWGGVDLKRFWFFQMLMSIQDRPEGCSGSIVFCQHGFLQKSFPAGVEQLVAAAIQRLNPSTVITVEPGYHRLAQIWEAPTWVNFANELKGEVAGLGFDWQQAVVLADSFATPLWQIARIDAPIVAFRIPRTGRDRGVLVEKYEAMADRCSNPKAFAKYQEAFPLLPEVPALAERLFRGAAKSGLNFEWVDSRVVAVRGFHDDMFHPTSALKNVEAVDTIDEALQRFGLN